MKAAFVIMSILGCDDSGATCLPVASVREQWATIAACDAASEKQLARYTDTNYPMVVAVCQTANTTALADSEDDVAGFETASRAIAPVPPQTEAAHDAGLTSKAIDLVKHVLPTRKGMKEAILVAPVHFVTDSYSWVARKIIY